MRITEKLQRYKLMLISLSVFILIINIITVIPKQIELNELNAKIEELHKDGNVEGFDVMPAGMLAVEIVAGNVIGLPFFGLLMILPTMARPRNKIIYIVGLSHVVLALFILFS